MRMLTSDDPLHAAAGWYIGDKDYEKWRAVVSDAEPILWCGARMDAPQMIPAGSMTARAVFADCYQVVPTLSNRDDDWAWTNCPISGARIRVPHDALKYIHE